MTELDCVDSPPAGWFVFEVFREQQRGWNWVAFMVDADPDGPSYRPASTLSGVWVRVAGKHRSRDAAWTALEGMAEGPDDDGGTAA